METPLEGGCDSCCPPICVECITWVRKVAHLLFNGNSSAPRSQLPLFPADSHIFEENFVEAFGIQDVCVY